MAKIVFFDSKPHDREFFDAANARFGFEIRYEESHLTLDTAQLSAGCRAVCVFVNDPLTSAVIERLHQQQVGLIALRCTGYNNVDLKAAAARGIPVVRVPAYSPHAVAEHAAALILSLNRKVHRAYARTRENNFSIAGLMGFDLFGKVAGVIGVGRIGKAMIHILRGFGMRVIAYDIEPQGADCPLVDLDTLYRESDVVTLHCNLTEHNHHMINRAAIGKMKGGVMLINTGRGGLVDTTALIEGLKTHKIGAAGLDVYERESDYFYKDLSLTPVLDDELARLQTFPNVLITSHQAFFTKEALECIAETTLGNIQAFLSGKPLVNEVKADGH